MRRLLKPSAALALFTCATMAFSQNYPAKTVRVVVPFPPVGAADLLARTVGQKLAEATGQQFIVDNRPGAGGNIGAELVAAATPDGYLLLMAPVTTFAVGMAAYTKLNWSLDKSLAPVAMIANVPHMLVVHPSLPVKNVKDVIALGKAHPGELNFASQGNGTLSHLEQEMLKQLGGFTANHIPYKGSAPGLSDLIPGNVQLFFDSIPSSAPYVKAGRLRGIGVASLKALAGAARSAGDRRIAQRLRSRQLVRPDGARRHAARHHRQAQRRSAESAHQRGGQGKAARAGRARARRHAGTDGRADPRRRCQVGQGRADRERQNRIA